MLKSKGGGKRSIHFCTDGDTIETVFRTTISVHQLSFHGAEVPRTSGKAITTKSCNSVSIDAGFLTTFDVGQYFTTKDTEEFSQFTESVACREYTLPRDENLSEPKGWIRGNNKIGPVLEVTTCYLQGKYGVEIMMSLLTRTILTRGSEFLMASISWSQT